MKTIDDILKLMEMKARKCDFKDCNIEDFFEEANELIAQKKLCTEIREAYTKNGFYLNKYGEYINGNEK